MARLRILYLILALLHGAVAAAFWIFPTKVGAYLGTELLTPTSGDHLPAAYALMAALAGSSFALFAIAAVQGFIQPGQTFLRYWMVLAKMVNVAVCGWFFIRHSPHVVFLIWGVAEMLFVLVLFSMTEKGKSV